MSGILFVCSHNKGKSRMAEGLLRSRAPHIPVESAGTDVSPNERGVNEEAREALAEVGARMDGDPLQLTASLADSYDLIVVVGQADISDLVPQESTVERWDVYEPSERGITGMKRMRMLREEIAERVDELIDRWNEEHPEFDPATELKDKF